MLSETGFGYPSKTCFTCCLETPSPVANEGQVSLSHSSVSSLLILTPIPSRSPVGLLRRLRSGLLRRSQRGM